MTRQPPLLAIVASSTALMMLTMPAPSLHAQSAAAPSVVVTDSSVRQGRFEAVAISRDTIVSTYPRAAREVRFRFSLNGRDNEFRSGTEHTIYVRPVHGALVTPLFTFGVEGDPYLPTPDESASSEDGTAQTTFRLDMRPVLRAFASSGVYQPPLGDPIKREDFQGVYVIGGAAPMTWDVSTLRPGSTLQLTDPDGDSIFTVTLPFDAAYTRPLLPGGKGAAVWARSLDVSAFPQLASNRRLDDALYRMSLEELLQNVRSDCALSAGAKWEGVWTRDVALSTVLALAIAAPDAVQRSLVAKVDSSGRIIQDTGTGGSWPISTDRTTWALAAWELYATRGDRAWLRYAYNVIRRSAESDLHVAFDHTTGLFRGESSFMDWREQSYPRWMQPADIHQSQSLSTNVVHYATYRVLANMARALGEPSARWSAVADTVRRAVNEKFWLPDARWYAVYRYGRQHQMLEPRSEGLGEALAVLYGLASPERAAQVAAHAPVVWSGMPSFWPYIPHEKLYHNAAVWPFVSAYWTWASADAGNGAGVERGLSVASRAAALFLTNKENMVASTGHFEGTELTSDRQLWSVAGTLASTYRVLFGIRLTPDHLSFRPMVPPSYAGTRTLTNLRYRGATLTVTVRGFGNAVASVTLDGRALSHADVPSTLTGSHTVEIHLNDKWPSDSVHLVANAYAPATPSVMLHGDTLSWRAVEGAVRYVVYRNGSMIDYGTRRSIRIVHSPELGEYQVLAEDASGRRSFLSEPVRVLSAGAEMILEPDIDLQREHAGYEGKGYVPLTVERNTRVSVHVRVPRDGAYAIDARYANGSGPINTDSKAAVRTLLVDDVETGALVMPQRGSDLWTDWGYSNALTVRLSAGTHTLTLRFDSWDRNMNGRVNTAMLDHLRVTYVGK